MFLLFRKISILMKKLYMLHWPDLSILLYRSVELIWTLYGYFLKHYTTILLKKKFGILDILDFSLFI